MAYNIQYRLPKPYTASDGSQYADLQTSKIYLQADFSEFDSSGGEVLKLQKSKDNITWVDVSSYTTSSASGALKDVVELHKNTKYIRLKTYDSSDNVVSAASPEVMNLNMKLKKVSDSLQSNIKYQLEELTKSIDGNMPKVSLHDNDLKMDGHSLVRKAWDDILNTDLSGASDVTKTAILIASNSASTYGLNIYPAKWLKQMKTNKNWFVNGIGSTVPHIVMDGYVYTFATSGDANSIEEASVVKLAEMLCKVKKQNYLAGTDTANALSDKATDLSTISTEKISGIS